jgi:hypothetical protein
MNSMMRMRTLTSAVLVVTPEEAFAVNEKIQWIAFSTYKGDLVPASYPILPQWKL